MSSNIIILPLNVKFKSDILFTNRTYIWKRGEVLLLTLEEKLAGMPEKEKELLLKEATQIIINELKKDN